MKILVLGNVEDIERQLRFIASSFFSEGDKCIDICIWEDCRKVSVLLQTKELMYDYFLIVEKEGKKANDRSRVLREMFGVEESRILDFFTLYNATIPFMQVDKMMKLPIEIYEGMILGISHAEVGIIPELFEKPFINLAVSSQDLYYNWKTLEYCLEKYPEKIKGLKYLIIDMFDYTYFNYDLSRSKSIISYLSWGGYNKDQHNFTINTNVNADFDSVVKSCLAEHYKGVNKEKLSIWYELFGDIHNKDGYKSFSVTEKLSQRTRTVTEEDVDYYEVSTSIVSKKFEDTIAENISIFCKILETAKSISPDIAITCILMPRYAKAQAKGSNMYEPWKKIFYDIIYSLKEKHCFNFIDLKDDEFSSHKEYYYDISHFNYMGAIAFTKKLKELILSEELLR